eukprot:11128225-Alexandrium_andersonii.AAC.1
MALRLWWRLSIVPCRLASSPSMVLSCCRSSVMVRSVSRSWSKGERAGGVDCVDAKWAVHCCVAVERPATTDCHCGAS